MTVATALVSSATLPLRLRDLSTSVDALGRSVTPLGELANRLPLSRRRQVGASS
jgi:hypothetical protein